MTGVQPLYRPRFPNINKIALCSAEASLSIPVSHTVPYSSSDLTNRPSFRAMNKQDAKLFHGAASPSRRLCQRARRGGPPARKPAGRARSSDPAGACLFRKNHRSCTPGKTARCCPPAAATNEHNNRPAVQTTCRKNERIRRIRFSPFNYRSGGQKPASFRFEARRSQPNFMRRAFLPAA